jgi:type II secretory pathway pseudopilin PulG
MPKPLSRLRDQAGDTIVEVLIVILVIGVVLASCYSIATASLQSTQLVQERTYALKQAESQLEYLKTAANSTQPNQQAVLAKANAFCLDASLKAYDIPGGNLSTNDYSDYKAPGVGCFIDPNNNSCVSYCYYFGIQPVGGGSNEYTASVRWDGPNGNPQNVQLSYRVY